MGNWKLLFILRILVTPVVAEVAYMAHMKALTSAHPFWNHWSANKIFEVEWTGAHHIFVPFETFN